MVSSSMSSLLENALTAPSKRKAYIERPLAEVVELASAIAQHKVSFNQAALATGASRGNMYALFGAAFIKALREGLVTPSKKRKP